MCFLFRRSLVFSVVMLLFMVQSAVSSETVDGYRSELLSLLSPVKATLASGQDSRFFLDKGSSAGIKKGDLFTVYAKGKAIKDAKGKVIGDELTVLAKAKATKVEPDYTEISYECIQGKCSLMTGLEAVRFKEAPALFIDVKGQGYELYEWLRVRLDHMNWQVYQQAQELPLPAQIASQSKDSVVFVAREGAVSVWSGGETLGSFAPKEPSPDKMQTEQQPTRQGYVPGVAASRTGRLSIENMRHVGSLGFLTDHMEIVPVGDSSALYFIYLSKNTVYVQEAGKKERATYSFTGFGDVMNISIGQNGLIALNIFSKTDGFVSRLLKYNPQNGTIDALEKDIHYFLSFMDMDADGDKETLLGQNYDTDSFWGAAIYRFEFNGKEVKKAGKFTAPSLFNLNGSLVGDLKGTGKDIYGFYNEGRNLVVSDIKGEIWSSNESLGGSIKAVYYDSPGSSSAVTQRNMIVWSQPALINTGGRTVAALVANESTMWNIIGGPPQKGTVGILYFSGGRVVFQKLPVEFTGPIQSVFVHKDELYAVVVDGNFFTGNGQTYIVAIPLKEIGKVLS